MNALFSFKEDLLHYLWKTKKIPTSEFISVEGKKINILDFGIYNTDAGPDFFNAKIEIDGTIWAGNIEMHLYASDWTKHKHQQDASYNNVILHVVYIYDKPITLSNDSQHVHTIELRDLIPKSYLDQYFALMQSTSFIPCQSLLPGVSLEKINFWKYSLTIERLEAKKTSIEHVFVGLNQSWEETMYVLVAKYFGAAINIEPFECVARSLPLHILAKNKDKLYVLEAIILGQAGMLEAAYRDEYYEKLKKEYLFQKHKYGLSPIDATSWKFSRLRPINFPTIRLAQFAALIHHSSSLFDTIKNENDIPKLRKLFHVTASEYWNTHYKFDTLSSKKKKSTGENFADLILINVVSPLLYLYGKMYQDDPLVEKAIQILEAIPAEHNTIIQAWKDLGIASRSAYDSQALIQLKKQYCDQYKCLSCTIGNQIISKT